MRILHVHKEMAPSASGVARHIDGLARAGAALGWEVTVFAPEIGRFEAPPPYRLEQRWRALPGLVRRADLVHVHGGRRPSAALAAGLATLAGRPFVHTPHCYYDHGSALKRLAKRAWDATIERALLARAAGVILLDDSWLAYGAARGWRLDRAAIIPNCVSAAAIAARRAEAEPMRLEGAPALLSVGRLDPVKRLDDAIAALSGPGLEGAILHIVGQGPDRARLEALAAASGRVRFHGWRDDRTATAMMLGADLLLLPSEREGLPTIVIEALLLGRPILLSDIPGNRAVADPAGWTALHPLGSAEGIGKGILDWAGRAPAPEIVARVAERFTWEQRAAEIDRLYRRADRQEVG